MEDDMKKMIQLIIGVLGLWILSSIVILFNLDAGGEPKQSDVIIVASGSPDRDFKAMELFHREYSTSGQIIVSPLIEPMRAIYLANGITSDHLIDDSYATSTYTNARNTLKMMYNLGYDSAIVVTADYHMLRTKMIYERQNRHYDFDLAYVSSYLEVDGEKVNWYENKYRRRTGLKEVPYFWGYLVGLYHFIDR